MEGMKFLGMFMPIVESSNWFSVRDSSGIGYRWTTLVNCLILVFVRELRLLREEPISRKPPPETFRARKAIFSSSVSTKQRGVYARNFWYEENLCSYLEYVNKKALTSKVWDFAMAYRVRKRFGIFEKQAPGGVSMSTMEILIGSICSVLQHNGYCILLEKAPSPVMRCTRK